MGYKFTINEFIIKANEKHKDKYNYSLVEYKNNKTKVKIIYSEHGIFEQLPINHLSGKGCNKCSGKNLSLNEFISKCDKIHNKKYNYSLVTTSKSKTKIKIICPIHGIFEQETTQHLSNHGCYQCKLNDKKKPKEVFITESIIKHNNKYDYSLVDYVDSKSKVKIVCPIHGEFEQTPNMHLRGQGCRLCGYDYVSLKHKNNVHSFSLNNWLINISKNKNPTPKLYIIECFNENEKFLKVGITLGDIKNRYPSKKHMPYNYKIIRQLLDNPIKIFNLEKKIHKELKTYKYKPLINFNGSGECYSISLLEKIETYI